MRYYYITLGFDCSTASALKSIGLRTQSLPFDWVVSDMLKIIECISEDFINFHKNLKLNYSKTRVVDHYGFEYPHDYPNSEIIDLDNIGNGIFGEKVINDNWEGYIDINLEKYNRRIERFIDILKSDTDLIVLYRGSLSSINIFRRFMSENYNKSNIKYIVATTEKIESDDIISCNPEINGDWNNTLIWKEAMEKIKNK